MLDGWAEVMLADFGVIWPVANTCKQLHQRTMSMRDALIQRHIVIISDTESATSRLPNGRYHGVTTICPSNHPSLLYSIEYFDDAPIRAHGVETTPAGQRLFMEYVDGITFDIITTSPFDARISTPDGWRVHVVGIVGGGYAQFHNGSSAATTISGLRAWWDERGCRDFVDRGGPGKLALRCAHNLPGAAVYCTR